MLEELFLCPTEQGTYMGIASQCRQLRHMYLWEGQSPPILPRDPCYFEPIGDRENFWNSNPVVWDETYSAVAGLTTIGDTKVPVYSYNRLRSVLEDYIMGVSNYDAEVMALSVLRRILDEDHGPRTPVILFPPKFKEADLRAKEVEPIKLGTVMGPPKL